MHALASPPFTIQTTEKERQVERDRQKKAKERERERKKIYGHWLTKQSLYIVFFGHYR